MPLPTRIAHLAATLSLAATCLGAPALAETRAETVVVTGVGKDEARAFVRRLVPDRGLHKFKSLARWHSDLCVGVIGVPVDQGQFIADRISLQALDLGLNIGAPGCDPNLIVVISDELETLLPRLVAEHEDVFTAATSQQVETGGKVTLRAFLDSDRPVRWWQVIERATADGFPLDGHAYRAPATNTFGGSSLSTAAESTFAVRNAPTVEAARASRFESNIRRQMSRIIVVVDAEQTAGLGIGAISDYVALVSLAQISPEADVSGYSSILNLFDARGDGPAALTDWDKAFLSGLYRARPNAISQIRHISDISARMVTPDRNGN